MRRSLCLLSLVWLVSSCATTADKSLPREAAAAIAGSPATLNDISRMLLVQGRGEMFNLGQGMTPDADLPKFTVTHFQRVFEFGRRRWRQDVTRVANYVTANTAPQRQITAVDGDIAFNVAADGTPTRAADTIARERAAELYHHPIGFLQAVFSGRGTASNTRRDGNFEAVDMTIGGTTYTMYVDPATKLPARITSMADNTVLGDVVMETTLSDYKTIQGHRLPTRMTTKLDKWVTQDITFDQQSLAGEFGALAAPEAIRAANQAAPTVTVEEAGPGVWYLTGQSHHSVLVEFADHLVLIESPQNDVRAQAVIDKAKEIRPDKPLRYLVNTHHHYDHSGGVRAAIANGLTVVTHAANRAFYEDIASRKHTVVPDALAKAPKSLQIETVDGKRVLQDGTQTLELYAVEGSPHSGSILMAYLPKQQILVEADLYTPPAPNTPAPRFPFAVNLLENVRKQSLPVARLLPLHGFAAPVSALNAAAERELAASRLAETE